MKLPSVLLIVTLALTTAEACASYKHCWCLRNGIEYQGKVQDNIAWDEDTVKACVANGGGGVSGYYGQNFKECYRYVKRKIRLDGAINNCDWNNYCIAAGKAAGVSAYGVCRDKISGVHVGQNHHSARTTY
ncbi:EC65 protein [Colletotrichum tofieldiae]|uniref:EC65 protein n=1 Tax=Colletotrichum tofieldiae TaxID=708197 RepID=A0A166Q897_9PEZI|nr:EC65 protein [Colletotrichum tofieldiae]